jgi:hypothetical protein
MLAHTARQGWIVETAEAPQSHLAVIRVGVGAFTLGGAGAGVGDASPTPTAGVPEWGKGNSDDGAGGEVLAWRCPAGGERVDAVRGRRPAGQRRARPEHRAGPGGLSRPGAEQFYEYGAREGVPRILDLLDKHGIKMTSFMIGDAVRGTRTWLRRSSAAGMRRARTAAAGSGNASLPGRRRKSGSPTAWRRSSRPLAPARSGTTTTGSGPA